MTNLLKNKTLITALASFILVILLYNFFFKSDTALTFTEYPSPQVGPEVREIYTGLQKVSLNQSVFTLPGYLFLTDFSAAIPVQPTGRPNPFDLIGRN